MIVELTTEASALLNALRTNQPHCIAGDYAYLLTETPRPTSTHLVLAIFNQNTSPTRKAIHTVNTTYLRYLLEIRPELGLLYHGYDPDDWRFALATLVPAERMTPSPEPVPSIGSASQPDYQQATLLLVPLTDLLTVLPDLNELIAFLVSDSDDHLVITRYAQRTPQLLRNEP